MGEPPKKITQKRISWALNPLENPRGALQTGESYEKEGSLAEKRGKPESRKRQELGEQTFGTRDLMGAKLGTRTLKKSPGPGNQPPEKNGVVDHPNCVERSPEKVW